MKKTFFVVVAFVLLGVVIAVFWMHIETKQSGGQNQPVSSAEYANEIMREPQQTKESVSQKSTNKVDSYVNPEPANSSVLLAETMDITEEKRKDMVIDAEQDRDKPELLTNDLDVSQNEESENAEGETVIKDNQARSIAREAIGDIEFDEKGEIRVEHLEGKIRVVFPVNTQTPAGTRYRGPDYAAEVYIDAQSGKVLQARQGS